MKRKAWQLLLTTALLLIAVSCANVVRPEGGEKDTTPPKVVKTESTPNYQVRFEKKPIDLTFNEWVELKDVYSQVVISPPLEYKFDVTIKRKTVRFEFDEREELRPEATYTINFGEAVRDLTEKNPAKDLRFVFSTGDYIDSLTVRGIIVDAITREPVEGALFMLYENQADSVVRTNLPFYFAKTDEAGIFQIENVKPGEFKGFALEDQNLNYRFDQPAEAIGFPDSPVLVSDSLQPSLAIKLFTEEQVLRLMDESDDQYGQLKLAFSMPPPDDLLIRWQDIGQETVLEKRPDTTILWYAQEEERGWKTFLQLDTVFYDTIDVKVSERQAFYESARLQPTSRNTGATSFNPARPIKLIFNHPIVSIDTSSIQFFEDTLRKSIQPTLKLDTSSQRILEFIYPWREGMAYALEIMPGGLTDIYGLQNDTITRNYQAQSLKSFGNLTLILDSLSIDTSYLLELYEGNQEIPSDTFYIQKTNRFEHLLKAIKPATYTIRVIVDWNKNRKWDTGNYDQKRQAEPIYIRQLDQLRANWDLESNVNIKDLKTASVIRPPRVPTLRRLQQDSTLQPPAGLDSLDRGN